MSLLRRGITGFDACESVDFRSFKQAVYQAAQTVGADVVASQRGIGVTPNFHLANIAYDRRTLTIVCNRHFPVVTIVECPIENQRLMPVEDRGLAAALTDAGFQVACIEELWRSLAPSDLEVLSDAEREEVKFWKPQNIGQVVFNWWD